MSNSDSSLYQACVEALTDQNLPLELIQQASEIVSKDNPDLPNLGRTAQEQEVINEVVRHINSNIA
ncbi:hypothetical protein [Tolypothrix sp. PCC 7601]|uniref:hypothetical protein n=1 Tax=Tolypothrix sp. PCC 7601 TaxID=1188 RepID=UPI0021E0AC9E|nr:hypothetical protein [Tolypothrix sp. PCC 7601]UYD38963.1 hypothetical protein HG267_41485 [Tolypothrix sp. PCC 7601]